MLGPWMIDARSQGRLQWAPTECVLTTLVEIKSARQVMWQKTLVRGFVVCSWWLKKRSSQHLGDALAEKSFLFIRKMRFLPHLTPHLELNGAFWVKYKLSTVHTSHTHSFSYFISNLTLSINDKFHRAPFSPSVFSLFPWISPQILLRKFRKFMA